MLRAGGTTSVFHNIDFVAIFGYGPVGQGGDHRGHPHDEVTVDDIRFDPAGPQEEPITGDIVVRGVAKRANGDPIPASFLDSAEFRDTSKFRGVPNRVEDGPLVPGGFILAYEGPNHDFKEMRNDVG